MSNRTIASVAAAAVIAATSLAATTGGAFAAKPAPAPHYKPLICAFLPFLDVCATPKVVHHKHHKAMMKTAPKPK